MWVMTSEEEHETVEDYCGENRANERDEESGEETKSQAVRSRDGSRVEVGNTHANGNGYVNGHGNGHANGYVNSGRGKVERGEIMSAPHAASGVTSSARFQGSEYHLKSNAWSLTSVGRDGVPIIGIRRLLIIYHFV